MVVLGTFTHIASLLTTVKLIRLDDVETGASRAFSVFADKFYLLASPWAAWLPVCHSLTTCHSTALPLSFPCSII